MSPSARLAGQHLDSPAAGAVASAAAQRDPEDAAAEGHKQGMVLLVQLQSQNPAVLLTLNVTPAGTGTFRSSADAAGPAASSPGRVVDVDVLQQLGSRAGVGTRAGQELQDSAVL